MLFQPYRSTLTAGQIREYLKSYPDHAAVELDGGGDGAAGHSLRATHPKEIYMLPRDYLSRRVGPEFAALATGEAGDSPDKPGCPEVFAPAPLPAGWGTSPRGAATAATYKPVHGGYPGEVWTLKKSTANGSAGTAASSRCSCAGCRRSA